MARTWTEQDILLALHLRYNKGLTCADVSKRFGEGKNSIVGLMWRINMATDKTDPDGNKNGTMPPLWWKRKDQK